MGLAASPEVFTHLLNSLIGDIEGVLVYVDDVTVHSKTEDEHRHILDRVLSRLRESGLRLNKDKCVFFAQEIEFLGYIWSADGIRFSPEKMNAMAKVPQPTDKQSLQSFLGLAGFLGQKSILHYSSVVEPLWHMMTAKEFAWTMEGHKAFEAIRNALSKENCRSFFDPNKSTVLQTDASGSGLGAVLLQDDKPVTMVSRKLTSIEQRYSQIEREMLAIVFGVTKLSKYLIGIDFVLQTDHKPIVQLFRKPIDALSNRLQRWLIAIQHFCFTIQHIKGSDNVLADALSRNSVAGVAIPEETAEYTLCFLLNSVPVDLRAVAEATQSDAVLSNVIMAVKNCWHGFQAKDEGSKPYFHLRNELCIQYHEQLPLLCKGHRVVIPSSIRHSILDEAHEGHMGICKMKVTLRAFCYWPKMDADIESYVKTCLPCTVHQTRKDSGPYQTISEDITEPWDTFSVDLTGPSAVLDGHTLLTVIDLYSRFPEAFVLRDGLSGEIVTRLRSMFARFGFPRRLRSDNGTPFVSQEFENFMQTCGIEHITTPLYYPEANATVERFHGTLKSRLKRVRETHRVPLQQALAVVLKNVRSTANDITGASPHFRMFNREMRTKLTSLAINARNIRVTNRKRNAAVEYAKKRSCVQTYRPGQPVFVRKQKQPYDFEGVIVQPKGRCSYEVNINGRIGLYHQSHLKTRNRHAEFLQTSEELVDAERAYDEAHDTSEPQRPAVEPQVDLPTVRRSSRVVVQPKRFIYE